MDKRWVVLDASTQVIKKVRSFFGPQACSQVGTQLSGQEETNLNNREKNLLSRP